MWPFRSTPPREPYMGDCPHCGGRIVFASPPCRNRVSIPTCIECNKSFDQSYSPSWVFVQVQTERRQQSSSPAKVRLRESQLSPPVFIRSRYWNVYKIGDETLICYDSENREYDVVANGEIVAANQNIRGLLAWISSSGLFD